MKKVIIAFIVIVLLFGIAMYRGVDILYGLFHPFWIDGPYRGKIIDAETKQPIEGVVVLGTWSRIHTNIAGANHTFYDARETVTDKYGDFEIRGMGVLLFSNIEPMYVLIFKAGYEYVGTMSWITLKVDPVTAKRVKWEGEKVTISVKKLTMEERKKQHGDKESIPDNKQKLLIMEVNKERADLGYSLYPVEN